MTIEERMDRLEKRNKRLTAALTVIAVTMCAVVTMAATNDRISATWGEFEYLKATKVNIHELRVKGIIVEAWDRDKLNETAIAINGHTGRGKIIMYAPDTSGYYQPTLTFNNWPGGGTIGVRNQEGKKVIDIGVNRGGGGLFQAYGPVPDDFPSDKNDASPMVNLSATHKTGGGLSLHGPGSAWLNLDTSDDPGITIWDDGPRVIIGTTENGGSIDVYNKTLQGVVELRADDYGNGYIGSWDRKGKGRTLQPGP